MQPTIKKADGLQHLQANGPTHDTTPLPPTGTHASLTKPVVPEGCEKVYAAIHGEEAGDGYGHMTWTR